jgi:hypothetical protein
MRRLRKRVASRAKSYAAAPGFDPAYREYNSEPGGLMNKRKRVAIAKHRKKKRKLKVRAAQTAR